MLCGSFVKARLCGWTHLLLDTKVGGNDVLHALTASLFIRAIRETLDGLCIEF
jgi:hypothetical protein